MKSNKIKKSSMWNNLIKDFNHNYEETNKRGYTLLENNKKFSIKKSINFILLYFIYFLYKIAKLISTKIWSFKQNKFNIYYNNYPETFFYFKRKNKLKDFYNFTDTLKIDNKTFIAAKTFYIYDILRNISTNPKIIIEIGAGLGNLAISLNQKFNLDYYIIIDLEEMINISSKIIKKKLPQKELYFIDKRNISLDQKGIYFISSDFDLNLINNIKCDIVLNVDSFQEMNENQIESYFTFIYENLMGNPIFLNINRRKYLEEERFDNSPLTYPYRHNSEVLSWKVDSFYDSIQNSVNVRKDPWIKRIEKIKS